MSKGAHANKIFPYYWRLRWCPDGKWLLCYYFMLSLEIRFLPVQQDVEQIPEETDRRYNMSQESIDKKVNWRGQLHIKIQALMDIY